MLVLRFDKKYATPVVIIEEIQQTNEDITKLDTNLSIYIILDIYLKWYSLSKKYGSTIQFCKKRYDNGHWWQYLPLERCIAYYFET